MFSGVGVSLAFLSRKRTRGRVIFILLPIVTIVISIRYPDVAGGRSWSAPCYSSSRADRTRCHGTASPCPENDPPKGRPTLCPKKANGPVGGHRAVLSTGSFWGTGGIKPRSDLVETLSDRFVPEWAAVTERPSRSPDRQQSGLARPRDRGHGSHRQTGPHARWEPR